MESDEGDEEDRITGVAAGAPFQRKGAPSPYVQVISATESRGRGVYTPRLYCADLLDHPDGSTYLATCGRELVHIYAVCIHTAEKLVLLQLWRNNDRLENYYACTFSIDRVSGNAVLAVGGERGTIYLLDLHERKWQFLTGHGAEVYALAFHPQQHPLLLSGSVDYSCRLWNTETMTQVAVFAGLDGHRDRVLSVAWHRDGRMFASSAMDSTVKLWALDKPDMVKAVHDSYTAPAQGAEFPVRHVQGPDYSTLKVHSEYIDQVFFVGDSLLSKCSGRCSHKVVLWRPNTASEADGVAVLREFAVREEHAWWTLAGMHPDGSVLAVPAVRGAGSASQRFGLELFPLLDDAGPRSLGVLLKRGASVGADAVAGAVRIGGGSSGVGPSLSSAPSAAVAEAAATAAGEEEEAGQQQPNAPLQVDQAWLDACDSHAAMLADPAVPLVESLSFVPCAPGDKGAYLRQALFSRCGGGGFLVSIADDLRVRLYELTPAARASLGLPQTPDVAVPRPTAAATTGLASVMPSGIICIDSDESDAAGSQRLLANGGVGARDP